MLNWKNLAFILSIRILIVSKLRRKPSFFDFSWLSNSCFFKTTGFISFIRLQIVNNQLLEKISKAQLLICVHFFRVLRVSQIQNVLFVLIWLDIQTLILQPPQLPFPRSRSQSKTEHWQEKTQHKIHCFSRRKHSNYSLSRYSNSSFLKTTGFIFSLRVGIKNLQTLIVFTMERFTAPSLSNRMSRV